MVLAVALVCGGCVSKGKYKALQRELADSNDAFTSELAARDGTIKELEGAIAERDARVKELEGEIAAKDAEIEALKNKGADDEAKIAALEQERAALQSELAAVVKDRARLKASKEEMERALAEAAERRAEAEKRLAEYRDLLVKFKALIDAGKLRVRIVDGKMVLQLPTDVLFASGSAKLSAEGEQAIAEITGVLVTIPGRKFQIEGHTDNVPIKTSKYPSNWELAAARAIAVVTTMIRSGMSPAGVSAASYGEHRPVASNDTPEGRTLNRRIEIVVVPDLSLLPGFEELNKAVEQ